jgi:hypothetical protein
MGPITNEQFDWQRLFALWAGQFIEVGMIAGQYQSARLADSTRFQQTALPLFLDMPLFPGMPRFPDLLGFPGMGTNTDIRPTEQ